MSINEAKGLLDEIVARAEHTSERTILLRNGRAVAAVISIGDLQDLEDAEDTADVAAAQEAMASDEPRVSHRDVMTEFGLS